MTGEKEIFNFSKKILPDYRRYAERIEKSLYYGKLSSTHKTSLPVTGLMVEKFGLLCKQDSLDYLEQHSASSICYDACVTPCSVIIALLYLDRLNRKNPEYLASTSSSHVFVVALMVASKFLYDDGEADEVFNDEWATSAAMMVHDLNQAELKFLDAMEWDLFVDGYSFMHALIYMEAEVAKRESDWRGYLTYTDIVSLSHRLPSVWTSIINLVGSAFMICMVSYTTTIICVVSSVALAESVNSQFSSRISSCLQPNAELKTQPKSSQQDIEEEEKEDLINRTIDVDIGINIKEPASFSTSSEHRNSSCKRRFHAISALTTALLFASSPVNLGQMDYSRASQHSINLELLLPPGDILLQPPLKTSLSNKMDGGNLVKEVSSSIEDQCPFCLTAQNIFTNSANPISPTRKTKYSWSKSKKFNRFERSDLYNGKNDYSNEEDEGILDLSYIDLEIDGRFNRVSDIGYQGTSIFPDSFKIKNCSRSRYYNGFYSNFDTLPNHYWKPMDSLDESRSNKFFGNDYHSLNYSWNKYFGLRSIYPSSNDEPCTKVYSEQVDNLVCNSEPRIEMPFVTHISNNNLIPPFCTNFSHITVNILNEVHDLKPHNRISHETEPPKILTILLQKNVFLNPVKEFDIFSSAKYLEANNSSVYQPFFFLDQFFSDIINIVANFEVIIYQVYHNFAVPFHWVFSNHASDVTFEWSSSPFTSGMV